MQKRKKNITEFNWWKKKSTSKGLPKGHPFLDRENDIGNGRKVLKENNDAPPAQKDKI